MYILADIEIIPILVPVKFDLKTVNFYLIKQNKSLTLIDGGYNDEQCWNALISTLENNNLQLRDLTEIILTHHHVDHVGLVDRIVSKHPIPVYASPLSIPRLKRDKAFFEMRVEFFSNLYRSNDCGEKGEKQIAYLHKAIRNNQKKAMQADVIEITEPTLLNFEVIQVPGHAPDQLAFLDKTGNQLIAGDLLIEHISSNALVEPDEHGTKLPSLIQHNDSLSKCMSLNVDRVYSGHGKIINNPNPLIKKRLERTEEKAERLLNQIKSGITTANGLAEVNYKKIYEQQFSLVMSEIIGHLDYLEHKQKIQKDLLHGIWQYSVTSACKI